MPVDSQNPDYTRKITRWRKQRDAFGGEDAIKAAVPSSSTTMGITVSSSSVGISGVTYLDRPEGFNDHHFARYVRRAKWYGATHRTVGGLAGAVFAKEMEMAVSTQFEDQMGDITLTGIDLDSFAYSVLQDNLLIGRYGILVDYNEELARPYWSGYPAESIINWRRSMINGKQVLSLVVMCEHIDDYSKDEYAVECVEQYRIAMINSDGDYEVRVYAEQNNSADRYYLKEQYVPLRRGQPLDFIPFQFFGTSNLTPDVCYGALDDLVDVNFAYFRHSADYEHGLFLTSLPTAIVTGHVDTDDILMIGSLTAWILAEPEAKAYFLEYQGNGLGSLEKAMDNDKIEMATLGARLLEEQPGVPETLGAVQLRHSGDTGSLRSITNLTSDGLSMVARIHHWWAGMTEEVNDPDIMITLNTDFVSARLKAQDLQALVQARQAGEMTREVFLWNLQQGELLPPGTDIEDEVRKLELEIGQFDFGDEGDETEDEKSEEEEEVEDDAA